jgi:hypothetical protein
MLWEVPGAWRWFDVPVDRQAGGARRMRGWLAVWIALLLAGAPVARPHLPPVSAPPLSASDERMLAPAAATAPAVRAHQLAPRVLPRLLYVEAALAPSSAKAPPIRPRGIDQVLVLPEETGAGIGGGDTGEVFHRSSVGTARTPTGPPRPNIPI